MLRVAWESFHRVRLGRGVGSRGTGHRGDATEGFDADLNRTIGYPTVALEFLRQLCLCCRMSALLHESLLIIIEGADLLIPEGEIRSLSDGDRRRIAICYDWFSDPGFLKERDAVVLITESTSNLHSRISRLPCLVNVEIPSPDIPERDHYIQWFNAQEGEDQSVQFESGLAELVDLTAGLSIHALRQLMLGARHERRQLTAGDVVAQVETFVEAQLGEGVVEFKKPSHTLDDVIGFSRLKQFLKGEAIPRFRSTGLDALSGAIVCGANGVGKSFIFEAVATELKTIVLVLKNIRSQWFGQTDVVFERLRRILYVLLKALIFVDEADTQFGGVGAEAHPTERRLTGKLQEVMSDPRLRGRITWLLMTARVHLLSPDIKRPGRGGDLIIPVLDPEGDDRMAFIKWMVQPAMGSEPGGDVLQQLRDATKSFFPAMFASVRSLLIARVKQQKKLTEDEVIAIVSDHLPPAITEERRFQTLQALVHCNRRSLLPDPEVSEDERQNWERELKELEAKGIT